MIKILSKISLIPAFSLEMFFRLYILSWGVAIFFGFLVTSYFGKLNSLIFSFLVNDELGYCKARTQGFGMHCFSDYYINLNASVTERPWIHGGVYPPTASAMFKTLGFLGRLTSDRLVLAAFLFLLALCLTFPIWHLAFRRKYISSNTFWVLLPISIVSACALHTLDRGNSVGLIVPFIYLLVLSILEKRELATGLNILVLIHMKQQFSLLLLIVLVAYGIRPFVKWTLLSGVTFLSSFLFYPHHLKANIVEFIRANMDVGGNDSIMYGSVNYVRISFPNNFSLILDFLGINGVQIKLFYAFYILLISLILICHKKFKSNRVYFLILILPLVMPKITWPYYYIVLLPLLIILLAGIVEPSFRENKLFSFIKDQFFSSKVLSYISTALLIGSMVPLPIPLSTLKFLVPGFADANYNTPFSFTAGIALTLLFLLWIKQSFANIIKTRFNFNDKTHN